MAELVQIKQEGQETLAKRARVMPSLEAVPGAAAAVQAGMRVLDPKPPTEFSLNATAGSSLYQLKRFAEELRDP